MIQAVVIGQLQGLILLIQQFYLLSGKPLMAVRPIALKARRGNYFSQSSWSCHASNFIQSYENILIMQNKFQRKQNLKFCPTAFNPRQARSLVGRVFFIFLPSAFSSPLFYRSE